MKIFVSDLIMPLAFLDSILSNVSSKNYNLYDAIRILSKTLDTLNKDQQKILKRVPGNLLNFIKEQGTITAHGDLWQRICFSKQEKREVYSALPHDLRQFVKDLIAASSFADVDQRVILRNVLCCFKDVSKSLKPYSHERLKEKKIKIDRFMRRSIDEYGAELVLPITQTVEFRLGQSIGGCYGCTCEWMRCLLNNKNPFGIDRVKSPPFKRIQFNSSLGARYPDLNHLAPFTQQIAKLQAMQFELTAEQKSKELSNPGKKKVQHQVSQPFAFFEDGEEIALQLINAAQTNPGSVQMLTLRPMSGIRHMMGFYKEGNTVHFMDANTGWFKFNDEDNFKRWLKFYFKEIAYKKRFGEYAIDTLGYNLQYRCYFFFKIEPLERVLRYFLLSVERAIDACKEFFNNSPQRVEPLSLEKSPLKIADDFALMPTSYHQLHRDIGAPSRKVRDDFAITYQPAKGKTAKVQLEQQEFTHKETESLTSLII